MNQNTNHTDSYVLCSDRLPTANGEYRVKNNSPVNGGEGLVFFDVEKGWIISKMVTDFYKVIAWHEKKTARGE